MRVCILVFGVACGGARTLYSQQPRCTEAETTIAMRECLSGELRRADSALGSLVDSLKGELGDSARRTLVSATDRWSAYRESECKAVLQSFEGGTLGPVAQLSCLIDLAEERQARLRALHSPQGGS